MAWSPITLYLIPLMDSNGDPYSGAVLKAYQSGTTTAIQMATNSTGSVLVDEVDINAAGFPEVSGNIIIPHVDQTYKLVLYPTQAAADAENSAIYTLDGLTPTGISADQVTTIATLTGLRNYAGAATTVVLEGASGSGDGAAGIYHYNSGSPAGTYSDNGTTIIVPTGGDGSASWLILPLANHGLDAELAAIAALAVTDGNIIVGNGSTWVAESGATARTSLGLGTGDSPTFTGVTANTATIEQINQYTTDVLSPTGDTTKDFGRICRITLNAQAEMSTVRLSIGYNANPYYAEFTIKVRQAAALNNDPACTIFCTHNDGVSDSFPLLLPITALTAFYTVSPTESYIDVYMGQVTYDDRAYFVKFHSIFLSGTSQFEAFDQETPIAALSWDVTSSAAPGLVVYDAELTLDNDFTAGSVRVKATRGAGGYWCEMYGLGSHASSASAVSTALIPSAYRPKTIDVYSPTALDVTTHMSGVLTTGVIRMWHPSPLSVSSGGLSNRWHVPD